MHNRIEVGMIDYENKGLRNAVEIEYSLWDGRFSAEGRIWQANRFDTITSGQNVEEIAALFPTNELVQRIFSVWKKWHLNDMNAGSPRQMEFLEKLNKSSYSYDDTKERLKEAGLDPDESYTYNGKPYEYGSSWLKVELPQSVIDEINSWGGKDIFVSKT